ncbi:MAG: hypothetical protein C9356_10570 [Oleiphilus sp.]|nr:MAG: hypothetical protein C9356_10570 [Oleiphilus sp.]
MKWLLGLFFLASVVGGYLFFLGTQTEHSLMMADPDQQSDRLARLTQGPEEQAETPTRPVTEAAPEAPSASSVGSTLDDLLREYEREVANMRPGEFEHFARQALSLEEQIVIRDSGHLEIQANIAVLLGNAIEFESIPRTDEFIEHQKIAWTYGMDAYRAINFMEQNQFGRLMTWEEMRAQIESPGFDSFKSSFPDDYPEVSDEVRAQLYQRVLSARQDPSVPPFIPLTKPTEP